MLKGPASKGESVASLIRYKSSIFFLNTQSSVLNPQSTIRSSILICLWYALCNRDCQKYLWLHFQKKRNYSETVLFCPLRLLTTAVIEPLERILSRPPLFLAIPYTVPLYTIPSMLRRTPRSNLSPLSIPLLRVQGIVYSGTVEGIARKRGGRLKILSNGSMTAVVKRC